MEISTPARPRLSAADFCGIFGMCVAIPGNAFIVWLWDVGAKFHEAGGPNPHVFWSFTLIICGWYWLWAVKNRCVGPIKSDAGVLTFLPGMAAGAVALSLPRSVIYTPVHDIVTAFAIGGCLTPTFYFAVPIAWFVKSCAGPRRVADEYKTPLAWAYVFYFYACGSLVFWPATTVVGIILSHAKWWVVLIGAALSLLYAAAIKILASKCLNARAQPPPRAAASYERGEYLPPDLGVSGAPVIGPSPAAAAGYA